MINLVKWRQKFYDQANKAFIKSKICQNFYLTCGRLTCQPATRPTGQAKQGPEDILVSLEGP